MTAAVAFALLAAAFLLLLLLERAVPLREPKSSFFARFVVNVVLAAVAFVIAAKIVTPTALSLAGWTAGKPFGLLHAVPLPAAVQGALGFLLMDWSFYCWHLANHKVRFLWRFHNVHHIDPDLDVTTALRFHFGEIFFSTGFRIVQVVLTGVSVWTYIVYETVFQANTLFHHSNVRLPIRLERLLNEVLVTPRMHGIHHSAVENETNSNYSVVFSWWDRLHGSLRLNIPQAKIVVGIPAYLNPHDNTFWNVLALPFRNQRDYWRLPDGTISTRDPETARSDRGFLMP